MVTKRPTGSKVTPAVRRLKKIVEHLRPHSTLRTAVSLGRQQRSLFPSLIDNQALCTIQRKWAFSYLAVCSLRQAGGQRSGGNERYGFGNVLGLGSEVLRHLPNCIGHKAISRLNKLFLVVCLLFNHLVLKSKHAIFSLCLTRLEKTCMFVINLSATELKLKQN